MPEMDGLAATIRIRTLQKARGASPVAIIAVTADAMEEDKARCLAAGMDGYIAKPIDFELLKTAINEIMLRAEFVSLTETRRRAAS